MLQPEIPSPHTANQSSIMLLMANALDCDALSLWIEQRLGRRPVGCSVEVEPALARCGEIRPRLLALDPAVAPEAVARGTFALRSGLIEHLLVIDRRPSDVRLFEILQEEKASYITRTAPPDAFASAMVAILETNARVFDPSLADRVRRTPRGYRLESSDDNSLLVLLSTRELQVMKLIASGKSVPRVATELALSRSTVDNHKWRIMRKLGVHKSSELTIRAIQDGLIHL